MGWVGFVLVPLTVDHDHTILVKGLQPDHHHPLGPGNTGWGLPQVRSLRSSSGQQLTESIASLNLFDQVLVDGIFRKREKTGERNKNSDWARRPLFQRPCSQDQLQGPQKAGQLFDPDAFLSTFTTGSF